MSFLVIIAVLPGFLDPPDQPADDVARAERAQHRRARPLADERLHLVEELLRPLPRFVELLGRGFLQVLDPVTVAALVLAGRRALHGCLLARDPARGMQPSCRDGDSGIAGQYVLALRAPVPSRGKSCRSGT